MSLSEKAKKSLNVAMGSKLLGTEVQSVVDGVGGIWPEMRYVNKSGSDTLNDGSIAKPFLTIAAALNSIKDASTSKRYAIIVGAGSFTETANLALNPYVSIIGQGSTVTRIAVASGGFTLAAPTIASAMFVQISDLLLASNLTITRSAGTPSVFNKVYVTNCLVEGNISYTGTGDLRLDGQGASTNSDDLFVLNCRSLASSVTTAGAVMHMQASFFGNANHSDIGVDASGQQMVCNLHNNRINFFTAGGSAVCNVFNTKTNRIVLNTTTSIVRLDVSNHPNFFTLTNGATIQQVQWNTLSTFQFSGTSAAPNLISAAGGITPIATSGKQKQYIKSDGGAVVVSANPQIAAGAKDGQEMLLAGCSDTDTVELADGNGLSLTAGFVMGAGDMLALTWDASAAKWIEMWRKAVA